MKSALVLITDGSEDIESVTIIDVLRRAKVKVTVAAVSDTEQVTCANGVRVVADTVLAENSPVEHDAIILPGGSRAAQTFCHNDHVQSLLRKYEQANKLVAAMCASTTALHAAGIGKGKKATSWPSFKEQLHEFYHYVEAPVAEDRHLITSRAPGTAMAWSLAVVRALCGAEAMKTIADGLLVMFDMP